MNCGPQGRLLGKCGSDKENIETGHVRHERLFWTQYPDHPRDRFCGGAVIGNHCRLSQPRPDIGLQVQRLVKSRFGLKGGRVVVGPYSVEGALGDRFVWVEQQPLNLQWRGSEGKLIKLRVSAAACLRRSIAEFVPKSAKAQKLSVSGAPSIAEWHAVLGGSTSLVPNGPACRLSASDNRQATLRVQVVQD